MEQIYTIAPQLQLHLLEVQQRILRATTPRMIVTGIGNQPGFNAPLYDQKRKKGKYTEQQPAQCHSVYVTPWLWLALVLVLEAVI